MVPTMCSLVMLGAVSTPLTKCNTVVGEKAQREYVFCDALCELKETVVTFLHIVRIGLRDPSGN